ncbi:hypothetical protein BT63DRAFT_482296 [Microthyrium microscopicum]|uniref:Zn(2)-C6 fungal-type domain-containing protein n=1 Tax=Microthyrium microscopicum TaxID=703497 RepID=A0A6A6U318_9PEZI|nr:hypothetical protein BT63DRAFT_482296 [Microthyrium microscopicum]
MVGTPKFAGCSTCRTRKIRCDRGLPACHQCRTAGWTCEGYERKYKFIEESDGLKESYQRKRYLFEDLNAQIPVLQHGTSDMTLAVRHDVEEEYKALQSKFRVTISRLPTSIAERQSSILAYMLTDVKSQALFPIQTHGGYFHFIPQRIGRNLALDDSISCLSSIYEDVRAGSTSSPNTLKMYGKSLSSLWQYLQQPSLRLELDTVCASLILQLCELMLSPDKGNWASLSKGSKLLMQELGSDKFKDPFGRAMLESQRTFYMVQDASVGKACFLAEQEWRNLSQLPDPSVPIHKYSTLLLRTTMSDLLLDFFQLLFIGESLFPDDDPITAPVDCHQLQQFLQSIWLVYFKMETFYEETLKPLLPPDLPRLYPDILMARIECSLTAILAKLQTYAEQMSILWLRECKYGSKPSFSSKNNFQWPPKHLTLVSNYSGHEVALAQKQW